VTRRHAQRRCDMETRVNCLTSHPDNWLQVEARAISSKEDC
jgi:hypothetical protein